MKTNFTTGATQAEIADRMDYLRSEISRMQAELNFLEYSLEIATDSDNTPPIEDWFSYRSER